MLNRYDVVFICNFALHTKIITMKKLFTYILLSAISLTINAQITFEKTIPQGGYVQHTVRSNGEIILYSLSGSDLRIYNDDFSLYKSIDIRSHIDPKWQPVHQLEITGVHGDNDILFSDNLFNTDSKFEFIFAVHSNSIVPGGTSAEHAYIILNEDGDIIKNIPSFFTGPGLWPSGHLYEDKNGVYLLGLSVAIDGRDYYSLPGKASVTTNLSNTNKEVMNTAYLYLDMPE
jgi:hypothetical protein